MPTVTIPLLETTQSVSRPIIFEAIKKLKEVLNIPNDTPIYYPGDNGRMKQEGSFIGSDSRLPKLANNDILFIEVEETTNPDFLQLTGINKIDSAPFFLDRALGVVLSTVYSMTDISINVKFRSKSQTETKVWFERMKTKILGLDQFTSHSFDYHYGIPEPYLQLLNVIHVCREAFDPYGDSFREYLEKHNDGRLTLNSDLVGKSQIFAVNERQSRIIARFGFDSVPDKPEYDQSTGTYTLSFPYKFSYEKPIACTMKYPIIVHNQLLPAEYVLPISNNDVSANTRKNFSASNYGLSTFEAGARNNGIMRGDGIVRIPSHDEFNNNNVKLGYGTILSVLCQIDVENRLKLFSLDDLGDYMMDSDVLNFLKTTERTFFTKQRESLFYLYLLDNESPRPDTILYLDTEGYVCSKTPLSLRGINRVCLAVCIDPTMVKTTAIDRGLRNKPVMRKILSLANENLLTNYGRNGITDRMNLTMTDMRKPFRNLEIKGNAVQNYKQQTERFRNLPSDITGKDLLVFNYGLIQPKTVLHTGINI